MSSEFSTWLFWSLRCVLSTCCIQLETSILLLCLPPTSNVKVSIMHKRRVLLSHGFALTFLFCVRKNHRRSKELCFSVTHGFCYFLILQLQPSCTCHSPTLTGTCVQLHPVLCLSLCYGVFILGIWEKLASTWYLGGIKKETKCFVLTINFSYYLHSHGHKPQCLIHWLHWGPEYRMKLIASNSKMWRKVSHVWLIYSRLLLLNGKWKNQFLSTAMRFLEGVYTI